MENERFKIIERSSVEQVAAMASVLVKRGYKPVAEVQKMPGTGLFTQVMHWEPQYRRQAIDPIGRRPGAG